MYQAHCGTPFLNTVFASLRVCTFRDKMEAERGDENEFPWDSRSKNSI